MRDGVLIVVRFMDRCANLLAVLAAVVALDAGCAGSSTHRSTTGGPSAVHSARSEVVAKPAGASRQQEEKLIQAYTDYATGLSFEERDDATAALEHFTASALADPSFEPLVIEAARRHLQRKETEQAIKLLETSAGRSDATAAVFSWLALAHGQAGHTEAAISANRQSIRRAPGFLMPYQGLYQIYTQQRNYQEAQRVLEAGASLKNADPIFCIEIAQLCGQLARQQKGEAEHLTQLQRQLLDRALGAKPESLLVVERLADGLAQFPETTPQAQELYEKIITRYPGALPVREKLFRLYLKAGQREKAVAQLEGIRREQPTNPATYFLLGDLAYEEKNYDQALELFATALRLDPNYEPVYYEMAGLYLTKQRAQDALDLLAKARSHFQARFLLEYYTGLAYSAQKNYQEAVKAYIAAEVFAKASEPERLTYIFYFQYGAAYERVGDFQQAEKYFRRSLELEPKSAETLNYLGYMWAERGQNLPEAREMIEKAVSMEPKNGAFLDSMAWVLFQLKKPAEALVWMEKAIAHTEEPDATLFDHHGDILAALQRVEDARRAWEHSLKLQPDDKVRRKLESLPSR